MLGLAKREIDGLLLGIADEGEGDLVAWSWLPPVPRYRPTVTLSPGRNLTITLSSGCSASRVWSFTFAMMSFGRSPAVCAGDEGTTCVITMPAVPLGRPSCAAWRGESCWYWIPMKPRTTLPFLTSSSAIVRTVLLEIANPRPVALLATSVFTPIT